MIHLEIAMPLELQDIGFEPLPPSSNRLHPEYLICSLFLERKHPEPCTKVPVAIAPKRASADDLEGVVIKCLDSTYLDGDHESTWLKIQEPRLFPGQTRKPGATERSGVTGEMAMFRHSSGLMHQPAGSSLRQQPTRPRIAWPEIDRPNARETADGHELLAARS